MSVVSVQLGRARCRQFEVFQPLKCAIGFRPFGGHRQRRLVKIETAITQADDEIAEEIERLRDGWTMSQVTIPAPPGRDEVDIDGFHHESSL